MIHESADVDASAAVDPSASVWGLAQIREEASIGPESIIGRGAYIGIRVVVGGRVKVQNFAQIYEPALIEDGAFIGPGAILTNDHNPRAVSPGGEQKRAADWTAVGVTVGQGASIGAGVVCVAPARIGQWALVGAGAVVTSDVPDFALVVGSPARQVGWVGRSGFRLEFNDTTLTWHCPASGETYREGNGELNFVGGIT